MRRNSYAAVSHLRCGTFSASFEAAIGHTWCVQHYFLQEPPGILLDHDIGIDECLSKGLCKDDPNSTLPGAGHADEDDVVHGGLRSPEFNSIGSGG